MNNTKIIKVIKDVTPDTKKIVIGLAVAAIVGVFAGILLAVKKYDDEDDWSDDNDYFECLK